MRSILRATAILGGGSLVSLAVGLVSAKASALLLGPRGVGYLGLLQSTAGLATLVASVGICGLVQLVSRARERGDARREAALRLGGWLLCGTIGGLAAIAIVALRRPLGRVALGDAALAPGLIAIAGAVLLMMAAGVLSAFLNAHRRVADLARLGVANSVLGAAILVSSMGLWGERGLPWALCAASAGSVLVAAVLVRRRAPAPRVPVTSADVLSSARALVSFGAPYTASALVGTGVQLALPVFVLHLLGTRDVGFYRAATGVSVTYLGFLIAAMGQDYYPRVSAVGDRPAALVRLVNDQYRVVLLLAGPLILAMLALAPWLIPLIYSRQFAPTVALLEWQLIGDVFKFATMTLSYVILANRGSGVLFLTELANGGSLAIFSWLGIRAFGLEGLGGAFLVSAAVSYVVGWFVLRRAIGLRLTVENRILFVSLVAALAAIRVLPHVGLERARTPVALVFALVAGVHSLHAIWSEVGGPRRMPAVGVEGGLP